MKYYYALLLFSLYFITIPAKAQDKTWLDSLKRIARQQPDEFSKKSYGRWANAVIMLGRFYEASYQAGKKNDLSKAIFYYDKLIDLKFGGSEESASIQQLLLVVDSIERKVAHYYFTGKGTRKDLQRSYSYDYDVYTGKKADYIQFSKKYFNTTAIILNKTDTLNYKSDSTFICTVNSFYDKATDAFIKKIDDPYLNEISKSFLQLPPDSLYFIKLLHSSPGCCRNDMCRAVRSLEKIKSYLIEKFKIPESKIITNVEVETGNTYSTFNTLQTPVIEISFTKNPLD